ncbi:hypothetical protein AA15669_1173 [Saccharibacter floricola DSM 15669]|uniref:Uncharacterized protein n=1 Tax=Saccharibacter floricola DSM 15669 TaxID=1123227 RepID=A0ABQ0NYZ1_9PROT|nr:hypothetical protein AA15669_1173 [Saccharibacter floricola DSM 15669]
MLPAAMVSCMRATIRPPPVSASLGRARLSHVHHAAGAAVPINPHKATRGIIMPKDDPPMIIAIAIRANRAGMATRQGVKKRSKRRLPIHTPAIPDKPKRSRKRETVMLDACVICSRKGRR